MKGTRWMLFAIALRCTTSIVHAEEASHCADLASLSIEGVEITKATPVTAGITIPAPYPGAPGIGPLPAHCRVDGVMHRRKGLDGEEFGIGFAVTLPEKDAWNGDFMMQGGGGGNGMVAYPVGGSYSREKPALMIFDPMGCDFDPAAPACKAGESEACIAPEKVGAIKKAFAGPKNPYGTKVYLGFLYDAGIAATGFVPGLLAMGRTGSLGHIQLRRRSRQARHFRVEAVRSVPIQSTHSTRAVKERGCAKL